VPDPASTALVIATYGTTDPTAPLVVLLHGRGSDADDIITWASALPVGPAYVAVRAPIALEDGFAWFDNRGTGRPVQASLRATMARFTGWLGTVAPAGRPVVLIGFSAGATFAGGLVLEHPERYCGVAVLHGTLPFDAGVAVTPGRLAGVQVLVAQGEEDAVIPRELLDRTWSYLIAESKAVLRVQRSSGGHPVDGEALSELGGWLEVVLG